MTPGLPKASALDHGHLMLIPWRMAVTVSLYTMFIFEHESWAFQNCIEGPRAFGVA